MREIPAKGRLPTIVFVLAVVTVILAVLLGGGPNKFGPGFLALYGVSSLLIIVTIAIGGLARLRGLPMGLKALLGLIVVTPLLQLVPLPPGLWSSLPGRQGYTEIRQLLDVSNHWFPLSLDPGATTAALVAMVPACALFLAVLNLSKPHRERLMAVIVVLALLSIAVGLVQLATGGGSLNFYDSSHRRFLLGFFANRNHHSVFLAATLCIILARLCDAKATRLPVNLVALPAFAIFGVAAVGTFSRAGLALFALVVAVFFLQRVSLNKQMRLAIPAGILVAFLVGEYILFNSVIASESLSRFGLVAEDLRWDFWPIAAQITRDFFPFGSGLGTFVPVYAAYEPIQQVNPMFVNRAHNDYLELVMETGALGVGIVIGAIWALIKGFRLTFDHDDRLVLRLLMLAPVLVMLHSLVDYPLRTQAVACVMSVFIADLIVRLGIVAPRAADPKGPSVEET